MRYWAVYEAPGPPNVDNKYPVVWDSDESTIKKTFQESGIEVTWLRKPGWGFTMVFDTSGRYVNIKNLRELVQSPAVVEMAARIHATFWGVEYIEIPVEWAYEAAAKGRLR